jgi:hypothetical protein
MDIAIQVIKGAGVVDHNMVEKRCREVSGEPFTWTRNPPYDGHLWIILLCMVAPGLLYVGTSLLYY